MHLALSVAPVFPLGVAAVLWGAPAAEPVLAGLAVLGVVDPIGFRLAVTSAIGVPLGAAVVILATLRWGLPARELSGLWRSSRRS